MDSGEFFGHYEIDTFVGMKMRSDAVLLTLAERETRFETIMNLNGKDSQLVDQVINEL